MYTIEKKSYEEFRELTVNEEGLVLLGCGGNLEEWVNGVSQVLLQNKCADTKEPEELFSNFIHLTTSGGRNDLALVFKKDAPIHIGIMVHIGIMAIWRLSFGNCSWISDYVVNYASHF